MKGFISKDLHPSWVLLLLIVYMAGGYFVAMFAVGLLADWIFGVSLFQLADVATNPASHPQGPGVMLMLQGVLQFFAFIVAPLFLLLSLNYKPADYLNWKVRPSWLLVLISAALIVLIMPANSIIINWNANLDFPNFMSGFEQWARQQEDQLAELTKLITRFETVPQLLVGLLVFAAIPAVGEELVFRGIAQRQIYRWSGNMHVAIWITGIIFGAIHVQFFGFFPRAILGALFGYLYFWSGRMSVPIVAHFVNNGFTVFMLYLQQTRTIDADIESTEPMPLYSIALSVLISAAIIYFLYQGFARLPLRKQSVAEAEEIEDRT
ncbi:CPBP family intramembrane glutamic endopeptidase [Pontibacter actiniarum]|uniref:CPBP family intramembrane metalloprotease domain-containing protein n=1 Tax=Pontibacter actiniarum TaxID=323450 RepID=A0A1X9YW71_9BACT|nr:CPBP family intramembrane glutamic endopeptidase [Pontibacter actiniarum]ARS37145.1 CPBP family intramembrane metalloprotease domain-containing protein [Pontibacter actiniarum]